MKMELLTIDLFLVAPMIALFLASIIPITLKVLRKNKEQSTITSLGYGFMGLIAAAGFTVSAQGVHKFAFEKALIFDGLTTWTTLIVLFVCGFSLLFSRENIATSSRQFAEYVFLLMNSAIGMITLLASNDLIVTFIGIEVMSLCLYLLIAMSAEERLSKEAAFKYFVLGSFASAVFLYGVAFVFGSTGTTYLNEIRQVAPELMSTNRLFLIGVAMIVIGLCFKVSIFPFHAWAPDVYEGAPSPVTGFMATAVKVVTFVAFLRVFTTDVLSGDRAHEFVTLLEWLAVLTMLVGNVAAIMQTNLKRMLAYSSVAHSGYVMVGLVSAAIGGESMLGASGVVFYVFAYSIMTLGAFGVLTIFEKHEDSIVTIHDLSGLGRRNPMLAMSITIFMLSLAGIPPTVGFFGKFFLFSAAIKQGLFWLAVWGVINSVISVYYYLRPVVVMYMKEGHGLPVIESRQTSQFAVGLAALLVIVIGIAANPFYKYVVTAVSTLF